MAILEKDTQLQFPHTLIIDASAGSGKTHTLTQRFIQFILSSKIPHNDLTNILAITFTNNAARQMKQRILEWLKKLAFDKDCVEKKQTLEFINLEPGEIAKRASKAVDTIIDRYSDFHIQTIDSFMSRILHCSAVETGTPLQLEITESYRKLTDLAVSITLKAVGDKIPGEEINNFLELLIHEADTFPWNPVYKIKKQFEIFLQEEGKVLEEIIFDNQWQLIKEKFAYVCEVYENLSKMGLVEKSTSSCKAAEQIKQRNIKEFIKSYTRSNFPFKKDITKPDIYEKALTTWGNLSSHVEEMSRLYSTTHYCHYGTLYEQFKKILTTVKQKTKTIHFDDINKNLSQYLNREVVPEIYYRLGDILHHFLLDEFQDTDRVQWENIQPLLEEAFSKGGSLFAVGDMKQAIYMFRKADYRIMRRIVNGIKTKSKYNDMYLPQSVIQNAAVIQLKENHRSGGKILDYVAEIFKNKLKKKIGTDILEEDRTGITNYTQTSLADKKEEGYVKTIIVKKDNNVPEKDVFFRILADVLSRYRRSDVTVLARKNRQVETIVEWLTEKNIPATSFSSLDIRKRKIIMEIMNLLQFLDSPIDNLSFASFIYGDIFIKAARSTVKELNRHEILELIFKKSTNKTKRSEPLYVWFREHNQFKPLWELLFKEAFNKVGYYPLYDLVSLIFKTFRLFDNFERETGFLVKFLEAIGALESTGMNDIKNFIQMVSENQERSILEVILPDYIDAVKVMTFHKAKGLGFPVVINMLYDSKDLYDNMFFEKDENRLVTYYITKAFSEKCPSLKNLYFESKLDEKIQNLNLLYVANTRAQKELYNVVIKKETQSRQKQKFIDLFENFEDGKKEKQKKAFPEVKFTHVFLPTKREIKFGRGEDKNWSTQRLQETKEGEFYHEILANIEFISDDIDEIVCKVCGRHKEQYDVDKTKRTIREFLELDKVRTWFEHRASRKIEQEVEYIDKDSSLYRFDRVVIDPDKIAIIDFKTGEEKIPYYHSQVKNYMTILQTLHPHKEIKGYLAFIDIKRVQEVQ